MKKTNQTHIVGTLYEHKHEERVTGPNSKNPGTKYINGTISIATDDAGINIVPIHYSYVTATTNSGKINNTYTTLKAIIDQTYKTVTSGADNPTKLRVDSAIGLNEFYVDNGNTEPELVSRQRNEGGFIHVLTNIQEAEEKRDNFKVDIIITKATRVEANPDKKIDEFVRIKGAIFDFRGSLLPVEFKAINPDAMDYFESLNASQKTPVYTQIWGRQKSQTIVTERVTESAFGGPKVDEIYSTNRDFVITGALQDPYIWDDESTITIEKFKKAITDREIYLATLKSNYLDYQNSKNNGVTNITPSDGFDF